jgi:hypothetical protein
VLLGWSVEIFKRPVPAIYAMLQSAADSGVIKGFLHENTL